MSYLNLVKSLELLIPKLADEWLPQFFNRTTAEIKSDGSIVTAADYAMQDSLARELKLLAPEIAMLSEEMSTKKQKEVMDSGQPYWCLDPVDGTNNFHHGVPLYAVSLALIEHNEIRLGIIYDPDRHELFSACQNSGLRINGQLHMKPEQPDILKKCLASVDFKRLNSAMKDRLLQDMPFKSQRNIGTCALEWAWLAAGRTQLILHGGEKFWDYAAGTLLLQEAGGLSSTDEGEAIFNNSLQNRLIIAASHRQLHQQWLAYLTA